MKKFPLIILIIILNLIAYSPCASPLPCYADDLLLRIENDGLGLYSDDKLINLVFYLPKDYFLKIISVDGEIAHVSIDVEGVPSLDGFVKKSLFSEYSTDYGSRYPKIEVITLYDAPFYQSPKDSPLSYVFKNRTLYLYGEYTYNDVEYCYAEYNGKIGYVKKSDLNPYSVPTHPHPSVKEEEIKSPSPEKDYTGIRLVIITLLFLAGIVGLLSAVKPKKEQSAISYYDENDFS